MSKLERFFKKHNQSKPHSFYAATKSLTDEQGAPLLWELKALTSRENDELQSACMLDIPIKGKPNQFRQKLDTAKYIRSAIAASVVFPDLMNEDLQNSYGVTRAEDLIVEMISDVGEWSAFIMFFNQLNDFSSLHEEVNTIKN